MPPVKTPSEPDAAIAFITALFGEERTKSGIYFCSLANDKPPPAGQKPEHRLNTRDPERLRNFIETWDVPDRGMFFCVGTTVDRRLKDKIVELPCIWTDVDYKDIDGSEPAASAGIARLKCKPTAIVRSGHGAHLYWVLKEALDAQASREHAEELLKLVCDHVAGDPQVCEISRLMRLPGTHNTKYGSWVPVEIEYLDGPHYTIEELEQWLGTQASPRQQPLLQRRVGSKGADPGPRSGASPPPSGANTNPFLRAAKDLGFQTPVDVEARLAAMSYQGAGDDGVHATQLQVTAALLERGMLVDDVVTKVFEATQALPNTGNWNWKEERRNLHSMCLTWLHKRSRQDPVETPAAAEVTPAEDNVVDLGVARAAKKPKPVLASAKKKNQHIMLGRGVLEALKRRGEQIILTDDGAYWYQGDLWHPVDEKNLRRHLNTEIEKGIQTLEWVSTTKLRNDAREWILAQSEISRDDIEFDAHERKIPVINGLLDIKTGVLEAPAPEHYLTWRTSCIYDVKAQCMHWLKILDDVLSDRELADRTQYIQLLQELVGLGLVNTVNKELARAVIFQGPANVGKSQLLEILTALYGGEVNATPLAFLENAHGTAPFMRRLPWILHEAFDEGRWSMSSIVKQIISGEHFSANPKGGMTKNIRFHGATIWATNHPPAFKETTRAIVERLVIIYCRTVFDPSQPAGLAKLAKQKGYSSPARMIIELELPGILAWAVEGLKRVLKRGYLEIPEEAQLAADELQRESNTAIGFVETCFDFDPDTAVSIPDAYAAYRSYHIEEFGDGAIPSPKTFGRAIAAMGEKRLAQDNRLRTKAFRVYCCVRLNETGMQHFITTRDGDRFSGKTAHLTQDDGQVNRSITSVWADTLAVRRARKEIEKAGDMKGDIRGDISRGVGDISDEMTKGDKKKSEKGHRLEAPGPQGRTRF